MKEVSLDSYRLAPEAATFAASLATIIELEPGEIPEPAPGEDPARSWTIMWWLGGRALGLVPVVDPASFAWAGPWLAWVRNGDGDRRAVVMYGVPSGVAWDPAGVTQAAEWEIEEGFVVAPLDVALSPPPPTPAPSTAGTITEIHVAGAAGAPGASVESVRAYAGRGLDGDRHATGDGTFPSGVPGSALTLIEAEVCESFTPPLAPDEHRRNLVTRGIELNGLVGHEFRVGAVRCRGMRLCEPCVVIDRYASRPVLRALVHRGGLRADILEDGTIAVGDTVSVTS